jgi:hypothetical protein
MPDYSPFVAILDPARSKLYLERIEETSWAGQVTQLAWDYRTRTGMWIDAPGRKRLYVCSIGVTHRRYWRLFQKGGGYKIDMRCAEHEVVLI